MKTHEIAALLGKASRLLRKRPNMPVLNALHHIEVFLDADQAANETHNVEILIVR